LILRAPLGSISGKIILAGAFMAERIGIAQVLHSLEVGGMERVALNLATCLDKKKWRSVIVCLTIRGDFAKDAEKAGVPVVTLGKRPGVDLVLPFRLKKVLAERDIRIVHGHNSGPWFSGTLASLAGRLGPVVITDHSRPYPERWRVRLTEWFLSRFASIVSVSEENKEKLVKNLWIPPEKIRVIPNGVLPVEVSSGERLSALRKEFGLRDDDFIFLCVARLEAQKGFEVLVGAAKILLEKGFRGRILVVGQGSYEEKIRRWAKEAGVEGILTLAGLRLDVSDFYHLADCLVLSSHWEGLPMSVLEAMSAGLPVVATDVGDLSLAVKGDQNGCLVPPKDPARLAEAMIDLSSCPEKIPGMKAASRKLFDEHFSVGKMVERYERLYEELL